MREYDYEEFSCVLQVRLLSSLVLFAISVQQPVAVATTRQFGPVQVRQLTTDSPRTWAGSGRSPSRVAF